LSRKCSSVGSYRLFAEVEVQTLDYLHHVLLPKSLITRPIIEALYGETFLTIYVNYMKLVYLGGLI